ncbi:serine/threonine-protein phosphatase 6 regulatory ankyrin repeat subunit B-like [Haliotis asinina]|uniref:serine/threonine-protein phosphatase 6 regulatory ankyrin repeat subunit B-like n=1 Tax=Haliotis asinina TaxID=109174 RepID=UPI00353186B5
MLYKTHTRPKNMNTEFTLERYHGRESNTNLDVDFTRLSLHDRCDSGAEVSQAVSTCVRLDSVTTSTCPRYVSTDEGYESKSISFTDRMPVQETDNNTLVTPVRSVDVFQVYHQDKDGDTDLHTGIIQGHSTLVLLFISAAPNSECLNIPNFLQQTPLHLAVITRQVNIVRRLMTAGARVDVTDIHGNTPLHIACREGYQEIVECLLRPVYYEETLLNQYEIPYQRIPQDLEKRNYDGHACLHLAAMSSHLKVLELLLSKKANINVRDGTSGRTVLHYAAETGNRILLDFLLSQRHLDICCRTYGGQTPLRLAAGRGYGDVVSILLANGADVTEIHGSDQSEDEMFDDFCINGHSTLSQNMKTRRKMSTFSNTGENIDVDVDYKLDRSSGRNINMDLDVDFVSLSLLESEIDSGNMKTRRKMSTFSNAMENIDIDVDCKLDRSSGRNINMDLDVDFVSLSLLESEIDSCDSGVKDGQVVNACVRLDSVTTSTCPRYVSTDEGYESKSISFTDRMPVQENDNNTLVTPVRSVDVFQVYHQDKDGDTDLHTGIIQGHSTLVLLFISAPPNSEWLNIPNFLQQTPLHLAVITRQVNIVRRLMTAGARVDVTDIHGNTPLHIACREGYQEIVECLLRPVYYEETLLNQYEIPYQRIPQDLEKRNYDGHACLHLAAMSSHLKVLELLLSKKANINVRDGTSGRTVLHYAAETGNRILLDFLLSQRHLDICCRTYGGQTPLRLAAGRGYGDVVSILLANGADVTEIDGSDQSEDEMFDDFCIHGHSVVLLFLEYENEKENDLSLLESEIDSCDSGVKDGQVVNACVRLDSVTTSTCPSMTFHTKGYLDICCRTYGGQTPLRLAAGRGYGDVVSILLANGADVTEIDGSDQSEDEMFDDLYEIIVERLCTNLGVLQQSSLNMNALESGHVTSRGFAQTLSQNIKTRRKMSTFSNAIENIDVDVDCKLDRSSGRNINMDLDVDFVSLSLLESEMDTCDSGVKVDQVVNACVRLDSVTTCTCPRYVSTDEGYESKSVSFTDRMPVQETDKNTLVTPVRSVDVFQVYHQDKDGDTDLHTGIIQGHSTLVLLFISAPPNSEWLNIPNFLQQTPLHLAVITRQVNIVRRLMTAGARVDVTDIHGNTPLHIACREGYQEIVECLLRPVYYEETLLNQHEIPYQRIPQDLEKRNYDGHACLHLAAMSSHLKVLELLLSKKANINVRDGTSGRTVLHYAAETGNRILLDFLLSQRHLDICCRTYGGQTPLRLAAGRGYGDVVSTLLANGADVTEIDGSDQSEDEMFDDFCINGHSVVLTLSQSMKTRRKMSTFSNAIENIDVDVDCKLDRSSGRNINMDLDVDFVSLSLLESEMDTCDSGVKVDQVVNACVRLDSVTTSTCPRYVSTDEGYESKSISFTDRMPVQETDKTRVTPVRSVDVFQVCHQDKDGDTDLHTGIIQGHSSLVLLFISAAPNSEWLNIPNFLQQTPLHLAVITRQVNIVRRLMTAGARVDVTDIHGNTPLHIACREGYQEIVECLLRPVYYEETLLNQHEIPYQRIPQDLEKRNYDGHACLHLAAISSHLKVLELLLSKKANINVRDGTSGRTVLHYAAETGNRILLDFLLSQRHLDICCRTYGGQTPLRLAAGRGYGDVVSTLLANGADVTEIDGSDQSEDEMFDDFCINGHSVVL